MTEGRTATGRDRIVVRQQMERFARLRSAHRALPALASDLQETEQREDRAQQLRAELTSLAQLSGSADEISERIAAVKASIDSDLDRMESQLLERFDRIEFSSLRGTMPRTAKSFRREAVALLESVLGCREGLIERLPKIEYLITVLATEDAEGRRTIVHDPATLTPMLASFAECDLPAEEAESIAVEFYQVASLDADADQGQLVRTLRSIRVRKASIGLTCLCPEILRALVTYNARIFNCIESLTTASRESDENLEELMWSTEGEARHAGDVSEDSGQDDSDEFWGRLGAAEAPRSVFESRELESVIHGLGRRLRGIPIGSCASERIALALDTSGLDPLEHSAVVAQSRDDERDVIARTTVVGLLVRDLGAVQSQLVELGIREATLVGPWIEELDQRLGTIVSAKVASGKDYALASSLSGIKSKNLLAAKSKVRSKHRVSKPAEAIGQDAAAAEMRRVGENAAAGVDTDRVTMHSLDEQSAAAGARSSPAGEARQRLMRLAAAIPLAILLGVVGANVIRPQSTSVEVLRARALSDLSPYVASAYRSGEGSGTLLVGRIDRAFDGISSREQFEAARAMQARLVERGIRDAMIYDEVGRIRIHVASGTIRRPHPPSGSASAGKKDPSSG